MFVEARVRRDSNAGAVSMLPYINRIVVVVPFRDGEHGPDGIKSREISCRCMFKYHWNFDCRSRKSRSVKDLEEKRAYALQIRMTLSTSTHIYHASSCSV